MLHYSAKFGITYDVIILNFPRNFHSPVRKSASTPFIPTFLRNNLTVSTLFREAASQKVWPLSSKPITASDNFSSSSLYKFQVFSWLLSDFPPNFSKKIIFLCWIFLKSDVEIFWDYRGMKISRQKYSTKFECTYLLSWGGKVGRREFCRTSAEKFKTVSHRFSVPIFCFSF